jgi:hypothetical protein
MLLLSGVGGAQCHNLLDPVKSMSQLKNEGAQPGQYWELLDTPSRRMAALNPDEFEAFLARFSTSADLNIVDFEADGPSFLVEVACGLRIRVNPDLSTGDYRINLTR